jgi:hypothetical protein
VDDGKRHPQEGAHRPTARCRVDVAVVDVVHSGVASRGGENLGQVDRPDAGPHPRQAAADVHQAGGVAGGAQLGTGGQHVAHLVSQHGCRSVGVLERERAAESAALVGGGQLDQVQPAHVPQQPQGLVADTEHSQRVTGRVVGHPVREGGADVLDTEHVDEQLGELVRAGGHRLCTGG